MPQNLTTGGILRSAATILTIDITTGAAPTDFVLANYPSDWIIMVLRVTSGGTGGAEVLHFVGPVDGSALVNTSVGRSLNIVFTHQTNPADVINVIQNTPGSTFSCLDNIGNIVGTFVTGILDAQDSNLIFGFNGDSGIGQRWNCTFGFWDNSTVIGELRNPMPSGGGPGWQLYKATGGDAVWQPLPPGPLRLRRGTVAFYTSNYPAGSNLDGMAVVTNALAPVVGSVVVAGGAAVCAVISNGTDYIVMFVYP